MGKINWSGGFLSDIVAFWKLYGDILTHTEWRYIKLHRTFNPEIPLLRLYHVTLKVPVLKGAPSVTLAPSEVASIVMYTILQSQAGGLRKGSESNPVCHEEIFK